MKLPFNLEQVSFSVDPRNLSTYLKKTINFFKKVFSRTPIPPQVWLDDVRPPPSSSCTWVKTVHEAKQLLTAGTVKSISLDDDLGEGEPEGRTLVLWMCETDNWPEEKPVVHSMNPVARGYMVAMIEKCFPKDEE